MSELERIGEKLLLLDDYAIIDIPCRIYIDQYWFLQL